MSQYLDPESGGDFSEVGLSALSRERQKEIIKYWFQQRYENPAESTPYESAEGGYIYIWGGPHNALEVLWEEFGTFVDEKLLDSIAGELEEEECTTEWASIPGPDDFDLTYAASQFYPRFQKGADTLRALLAQTVGESEKSAFLGLLYANAITLLEAYLSDVFISVVLKYPNLLRKFVESEPVFKERTFPLSELYQYVDGVHDLVREHLKLLPFHRLEKVRMMYKAVLEIGFPSGMADVFKAILVRHDLVHRNGITKEGQAIDLSTLDVDSLLTAVETLVGTLDGQVQSLIEGLELPPPPDILDPS